jgi:thiamine kinase
MAAEVPPEHRLTAPPAWALAMVPGLESGAAPLRVEALGGGTVNSVHRVDTAQGRFVLRLDGPQWGRPGVDRARELALHRIAAEGGIAPRIVVAQPQRAGLLVTQYHEGRLWGAGDYSDLAQLRELGQCLSELHRLPPPAIEPFDPLAVGEGYAHLIAPEHGAVVVEAMRRLEKACVALREDERVLCVVHGDLWGGNLLQGKRLWLLDWEYAQVTDPLMDVACLLAYYPQVEPHAAALLAAAGFDARRDREALLWRVEIYRTLTWLWRLARGEDVSRAGQQPAAPAN